MPPAAVLPSEHLRMLVDLLRPIGPELARRWLAALLMVDQDKREEVVAAVERQLVADDEVRPHRSLTNRGKVDGDLELRLVSPPVARDGYVEEKITTYAVSGEPKRRARGKRVS